MAGALGNATRLAIATLVIVGSASAWAALTTWPTDGPQCVTGNYGMHERTDAPKHHPELDIPGQPNTTFVRAVRDGEIWYVHPLNPSADSLITNFEVKYGADTLTYSSHRPRPLDPSHSASGIVVAITADVEASQVEEGDSHEAFGAPECVALFPSRSVNLSPRSPHS